MATTEDRLAKIKSRAANSEDRKKGTGRQDWSSWPAYEAAGEGLRNYWYPVQWSSEVGRSPVSVRVCAEDIVLQRDEPVSYTHLTLPTNREV